MSSFNLAFQVVCPLFLMLLLGYFLRKIGLFTEPFLKQLNKVCFQVFLPLILFMNVYTSDFSSSFQPRLILFSMVSVTALFLLLICIVPLIEKSNARRGVIIQGVFRSNYILFGLPMATTLFGADNVGTTAVLAAFVVPLFNVLSVVALEVFRGHKMNGKRIIKGIATNPLIIGAVVALVIVFCGIRLPTVLENTARDISGVATPLALICLGGSLTFSKMRDTWRPLVWSVVGKLILAPLIMISISIAMGYRGVELGALLAIFVSPTAVSSFTMAQQMGADDQLAGQIVVFTSVASVVTIFAWISVLGHMGLGA